MNKARALDWLIAITSGLGAIAASFGDWDTAGSLAMFLLGLLTLEVRQMRQARVVGPVITVAGWSDGTVAAIRRAQKMAHGGKA